MKKLFLLLALLWASPIFAQVQLWPIVKEQIFDSTGRPLSNGCIFTYISGTNTPQATYTDFTGGTPNPNPIVLDGSGRPPLGTDVWLGAGAYRIKVVSQGGVNCASGVQLYVEDGITSSSASILASNNTWTGTNTFNGPTVFNGSVTMNVGFTSNGPSNLSAGGSLAGTFSGSPIFSGSPNFSGGFFATTGTFSGQIISTVATGTPAFVIASTTQIPNLDASELETATWESPNPIGVVTPNAGVFTALAAMQFGLNGGTTQTATQGTDTTLLTSGTFTGTAGTPVCKDANGGATTIGCAGGGFSALHTATAGGCTTQGTSYANCDVSMTWSAAFADTAYIPTCSVRDTNLQASGGDGSTGDAPGIIIRSFTTTTITATIQTLRGAAITAANTTVFCTGVHP